MKKNTKRKANVAARRKKVNRPEKREDRTREDLVKMWDDVRILLSTAAISLDKMSKDFPADVPTRIGELCTAASNNLVAGAATLKDIKMRIPNRFNTDVPEDCTLAITLGKEIHDVLDNYTNVTEIQLEEITDHLIGA